MCSNDCMQMAEPKHYAQIVYVLKRLIKLAERRARRAAKAAAVAEVPVAAGVAFPTDVAAGRAIGAAVASAAIARYQAEAFAAPATGPTAPSAAPPAVDGASGAWPGPPVPLPVWHDAWPLSPAAGGWTGWTAGAQASAPPPPADAQTARELGALVRDNRGIVIRERAIALKWHETDMARRWSERAAELAGRSGPAGAGPAGQDSTRAATTARQPPPPPQGQDGGSSNHMLLERMGRAMQTCQHSTAGCHRPCVGRFTSIH
jgi:hypothetical protein